MNIINNNYLPPEGFKAIGLFGLLFKRRSSKRLNTIDLRHELIHYHQFTSTTILALFVSLVLCCIYPSPFWAISLLTYYIMYGLASLLALVANWIVLKDIRTVIDKQMYYFNNIYEIEAYRNEHSEGYTYLRKAFSEFKYIGEITKNY